MSTLELILLSLFVSSVSSVVIFLFSIVFNNLRFSKVFFMKFFYILTPITFATYLIHAIYPTPQVMLAKTIISLLAIYILTWKLLKSNITMSLLTSLFTIIILGIRGAIVVFVLDYFKITYIVSKNSFSNSLIVHIIIFTVTGFLVYTLRAIKLFASFPKHNNSKPLISLILFIALIVSIIILNTHIFSTSYHTINNPLPFYLNIFLMLSALIVSLYITTTFFKLEKTSKELKKQTQFNQALASLVSELRSFKHNYNNRISTINGYVAINDLPKLKTFMKEVMDQSTRMNLLDSILLSKINNPALLGLLISKVDYAITAGVYLQIVSDEIEDLSIKNIDLTEILGILWDNAIEAASQSKIKSVNITISNKNNTIRIKTENSCAQLPDISLISQKDYSTKGNNRGIGLWYVQEKLKLYPKVKLHTYIEKSYFIQELEI